MQTRRNMLRNAAKASLGIITCAVVSPLILNGCKKSETKNSDANVDAKENFATESCPNQETINAQDQAIRNSLKYVDNTPIRGRTCDNCKLYTLPQPSALCGGCKVVPGPIHPKGYCTAWLHRM